MKTPLLATMACILIGCVQTQRVTLVAAADPDAHACFTACAGSATCARACPGVTVEDGACQNRSERPCVASGEVNSVGRTMLVTVLGSLAVGGLMYVAMSAFTPTIGPLR